MPNYDAALQVIRHARRNGNPSWEDVHAGLARAANHAGEWAGYPMPVKGMRMVIHPSYPFAKGLGETFMPTPDVHLCRNKDIDEQTQIRNEWRSYRDGKTITVWRDSKGFFFSYGRRQNSGPMLLETLGAARAWDFAAEMRSQETLKRHVTEWAFQCYLMTGTFLETSKRSEVSYMFRRLRPTLAITGRPDSKGRDGGLRILAALCAHPIGYYDGSWAGALVPTDDVIAHLLLMRADEHLYWKQCNQHPAWAPEAGL
jgi:hypothetical protein